MGGGRAFAFAACWALASGCGACLTLDPGPYPCDPKVGPDPAGSGWTFPDGGVRQCLPGWVCGLEGICHDLDAGPYQCTDDSWCEGGWRCSAGGVCVDASADGLNPAAYSGPLTQTLLSPLVFQEPPVAAASFSNVSSLFALLNFVALVEQADGGVVQLAVVDGGLSRTVLPAPAGVTALATTGANNVFLGAGGLAQGPLGGTPTPVTLPPGFVGDRLRVVDGFTFDAPRTIVLAEDAGQFVLVDGSGTATPGNVSAPTCGPAQRIDDWAEWSFPNYLFVFFGSECVVAATELGLFAADQDAFGGFHLTDGGTGTLPQWHAASCDAGAAFVPRQLFAADDVLAAAAGSAVELFQGNGTGSCTDGVSVCCGGSVKALVLPPCPVCPFGGLVTDVHPFTAASNAAAADVRCTDPQSQENSWYEVEAPACVPAIATGATSSLFTDQLAVSTSRREVLPYLGSHGQAWLGIGGQTAHPIFLDHAPTALAELDGGALITFESDAPIRAGATPRTTYGTIFLGLGLAETEQTLPPLVGVAGTANWLASAQGDVLEFEVTDGGGRAIAYAGTNAKDFQPPVVATVGPSSDAGLVLVVAGFDTLYSAEVQELLESPGSQPVALEPRVVPFALSPVQSLTLVPPSSGADGGALWLEGYALTGAGLFHLTAWAPESWTAEPVAFPLAGPIALWADGARGRLGLQDGSIYSLPSRVLIAPALPETPAQAFAFTQYQGQPMAAGAQSVYRLFPPADGGAVGDWVAAGTLPDIVVGAGDPGLSAGYLWATPSSVYVFTGYGGALRYAP